MASAGVGGAKAPAVRAVKAPAVDPAGLPAASEPMAPAVRPVKAPAVGPAGLPAASEPAAPAVRPVKAPAVGPAGLPAASEPAAPAVRPVKAPAVDPGGPAGPAAVSERTALAVRPPGPAGLPAASERTALAVRPVKAPAGPAGSPAASEPKALVVRPVKNPAVGPVTGRAAATGTGSQGDQRDQPAACVQSTARRAPGAPRPARRGVWTAGLKWRMLGLIASVLVLVTAGAVIVTLSRHPAAAAGRAGQGGGRGGLDQVAIDAEAVARGQAAAWITREVSRDAILSCDPLMCLTLRAHGIPAGDLLVLRPGMPDPLGSELVVATSAVRSQFGSMLSDVFAPTVIASFGTGSGAIPVRVIAPDGVRAYDAALSGDVQARRMAGEELSHNKRIMVSVLAAKQLAAGQVDSRLLVTLATMAALNPVHVAAFGDPGPGASPGVPLRSVDLSAMGGAPWTGRSAYVRSALALLRAQLPPYQAASVGPVPAGGDQTVLRIEFGAPSPLGLLGHKTP